MLQKIVINSMEITNCTDACSKAFETSSDSKDAFISRDISNRRDANSKDVINGRYISNRRDANSKDVINGRYISNRRDASNSKDVINGRYIIAAGETPAKARKYFFHSI